MDQSNPYASPRSDLTRPASTALDTTGPFDPKGRFTRLSWLAWNLVLGLLGAAAVMALALAGLAVLPSADALAEPPLFMIVLMVIPQLIVIVLAWILAIRRFHDINASGWWSATLLLPLGNLIAVLVLAFKRGDETANRFGPPRPTPNWERVLGIIYIVLLVVGLVGGIVGAIAIPAYMNYQAQAALT